MHGVTKDGVARWQRLSTPRVHLVHRPGKSVDMTFVGHHAAVDVRRHYRVARRRQLVPLPVALGRQVRLVVVLRTRADNLSSRAWQREAACRCGARTRGEDYAQQPHGKPRTSSWILSSNTALCCTGVNACLGLPVWAYSGVAFPGMSVWLRTNRRRVRPHNDREKTSVTPREKEIERTTRSLR